MDNYMFHKPMEKQKESLDDIHRQLDRYDSRRKPVEKTTVEDIFSQTPMELKKATENLSFINKIRDELPFIKEKKIGIDVFGVKKINLEDILAMNIWDRSILTTDAVSRLVFKMNLNQLQKYLPKKITKGFEFWWLLLLLGIGGGAFLLIMLFLAPQLGGIKLF